MRHWIMLLAAAGWKLGPLTLEVADSLETATAESMLAGFCAIC